MFVVETWEKTARVGHLVTDRGVIRTPAFMPVGTLGTVKTLELEKVSAAGSDIILGNTYHLMLRPGAERTARLGGLHKFIGWGGPILTDSGGFQVMSLAPLCSMSEESVVFRSHLNGMPFELSPERSIQIQCLLGSDIQMVLDWCLPFGAPLQKLQDAMALTWRWARRSKAAFEQYAGGGQKLFGIVQGGTNIALRVLSAIETVKIGFDGYAIGGLAVGEKQADMLKVLDETIPFLPINKPRYLMGVGTPLDILEASLRGVDMFDCVYPTRAGRHGLALTHEGKINLGKACWAEDLRPLDTMSTCPASHQYSRAYLHHLIRCKEALGAMVVSWNNICYYQSLMQKIREAIAQKTTASLRAELWRIWKTEKDH